MGTPGGALTVAVIALIVSIGSLTATVILAVRRERFDTEIRDNQANREALQRISELAAKVIRFHASSPATFKDLDEMLARLLLEQKTPGSPICSDKQALQLIQKGFDNLSEVRELHRENRPEAEDAEVMKNYTDSTMTAISLVYMVAVKNTLPQKS